MDGGRVLRAVLATRLDYVTATQIAAGVGQMIAVVFAVVGIMSHSLLLRFVALFVFLAAGQESSMHRCGPPSRGSPSRAPWCAISTLRADDPLTLAVELLLAGDQQEFPVLGRLGGHAHRDPHAPRPDRLSRRVTGPPSGRGHAPGLRHGASPGVPLRTSSCASTGADARRSWSVSDGRVVGMVTLENVGGARDGPRRDGKAARGCGQDLAPASSSAKGSAPTTCEEILAGWEANPAVEGPARHRPVRPHRAAQAAAVQV